MQSCMHKQDHLHRRYRCCLDVIYTRKKWDCETRRNSSPWPEWAMSAWRYPLDARASTSVIQRWWRRNIGHGLTTCCKWAMQFKCLPTSKNKREFFGSCPSSSSEVSTENPENSRSAQKHFTVQLQLRYYSALASLQSVLIEDGNGMVLQTIGNAVFVFTQLIH